MRSYTVEKKKPQTSQGFRQQQQQKAKIDVQSNFDIPFQNESQNQQHYTQDKYQSLISKAKSHVQKQKANSSSIQTVKKDFFLTGTNVFTLNNNEYFSRFMKYNKRF